MKKALAIMLMFSIASIGPFGEALACTILPAFRVAVPQEDDWQVQFSPDQLENLVAPIALYPDPLLAQVLLAATFPEQIDEAARSVRAYGANYNVDAMYWDVSVKAVAHYPTVLSMMADKIDWTTSLGQAYVNQSTDVMDAVQRLRAQARSLGNLMTTPEQEIVETDGYIYIYPAQPSYIYVPVYDPAIIFFRRPFLRAGPLIWFGVGLMIGAWLNHDFDWHGHRVFYHGWERGPRWIERSRPHVRINNIYVNNRYRDVAINRHVNDRNVNYGALNRYNNIHRDVNYDNVRRQRGDGAARAQQPAREQQRDNKIIRRNIDPRDPRIDANRGRDRQPGQPDIRRPDQPRPDVRPPVTPRPPEVSRPETPRQPEGRPETRRPDTQRPPDIRPPQTRQPEVPRPAETRRPEQIRPPQQPRVQPPQTQQPHSVFRGNTGAIDSRSAGQRGQESRQQPPAAARPAPPQRTAPQQPPKSQDRGHDRRPR
jgi:hypothetical protein